MREALASRLESGRATTRPLPRFYSLMCFTRRRYLNLPIPHALAGGVGATPAGAAWLQRLPQLVQRAQQRWGLHLAEPFGVGTTAWTAPGTCADGTPIVLKVTFPHDEARDEAAALGLWHGLAAVELLDHHQQDWALLLRRAHPGTLLLHDPAPETVRLNHGLQVLANLHRAKAANAPLSQLPVVSGTWAGIARARAHRWQHLLHGVEAPVAAGLDLLHRFADPAAMPAPQVVLHGDLNPGNLLLDSPPGHPAHWLAIDPKPMLGDPAYDVWPLVSQIGSPFADHAAGPFTVMHQRVQLAAAALGIPGLRIAQWGLARTVEAVLWQRETFPVTATVASAEEQLQLRVWHWLAGY